MAFPFLQDHECIWIRLILQHFHALAAREHAGFCGKATEHRLDIFSTLGFHRYLNQDVDGGTVHLASMGHYIPVVGCRRGKRSKRHGARSFID